MTLAQRVAVVVGAASGIGRATAAHLAREGDAVVLVDWDDEALAEALGDMPGSGHRGVTADVTDARSLSAEAELVCAEYGHLENLVIAAGVLNTQPAAEIGPEAARHVFDVNVLGALAVVQAHVDLIRNSIGDRSIVLLSSVAASVGGGLLGTSVYASSKAAVEGLARGLARELVADGIRVNAVAPGPVDTPLLARHGVAPAGVRHLDGSTLMGRLGRPEEIATTIGFLTSTAASYLTGQVLHPNGGLYFG